LATPYEHLILRSAISTRASVQRRKILNPKSQILNLSPVFQLDPQSIATRTLASPHPITLPSLGSSIVRGAIGFTAVSVAGFLPWPIFDHWFPSLRETHLYIACTLIFIGLSGPCLHRLILGPGSLPRFYKLFALSFIPYVAVWVTLWVAMRDERGVVAGFFGGTAVMGLIFSLAFRAPRATPKSIAALFVFNILGYYAGQRIEGKLIIDHPLVAILLWALCYGIGFGAGLGAAFHVCQAQARELIAARTSARG
jgi:hypothetical protein